MHTNHRRKKGRHNPKKGQGWSNYSSNSLKWYKQDEARKFRRRARYLIQARRYAKVWVGPIKKGILWRYW